MTSPDGDHAAAEAFFRGHLDGLYQFVHYRVGGRRAVVEDVVQEVFLKFSSGLFINRRKWFVHQQNFGVDRECTGQPDTLAHTTGKFVRVSTHDGCRQADLAEQVGDAILFFGGTGQPMNFQGGGDDSANRLSRVQ